MKKTLRIAISTVLALFACIAIIKLQSVKALAHSDVSQAGSNSLSVELAQACRNTDIRAPQTYQRGARIPTCNGHLLIFQQDGNLVLYNQSWQPVWATGTDGSRADRFVIQNDGNVVLYAGNSVLWATDTAGNPGAFLSVQIDGNLVVYNSTGRQALFSTDTHNGRRSTLRAAADRNARISARRPQSSSPQPQPLPGNIDLPFRVGETWYVCQGYNGSVSHGGIPALDLTIGSTDFGQNNACLAWDGNVNRSANRPVLAPIAGTVSYLSNHPDVVCLSIDSNRSLVIGHINGQVSNGQRVNAGTVLGLTSEGRFNNGRQNTLNGGFSHIHIEAKRSQHCGGASVPFTAQNGFQFRGIGDLAGGQTHWQRALSRRS